MTGRYSTQARDHAVMCFPCGTDHRNRPRTMTWNSSGLCDRHEAADERAHAVELLVEQGYGRQIAEQIVDRVAPVPAQRTGG